MKKTYLQPSLKVKSVRVAQILQTSVVKVTSTIPASSESGVDAKEATWGDCWDNGEEDL